MRVPIGIQLMQKYASEYPSNRVKLANWLREGKLKYHEHITRDFENLPKAYIDMYAGGNIGKSVVVVD